MNPTPVILIVEDEEAIMMGLQENLVFEGYEVLTATTGPDGYQLATSQKPDLVILDVMMPGMSGYDVCRKIREDGLTMPIIMLTARQEEFDKVLGFEMGADDYVTKPFSLKELLARINVALKRSSGKVTPESVVFEFGDCRLDTGSRTLSRAEKDVPLTRTEFTLLHYLIERAGSALSREVLMNDVWGTEYYGTQRSLDSFIANLRGKIEVDPKKPRFIHTVHGVGYKFVMTEKGQ